jgi:alpha-maltose-1-phosphate synthase
MRLLHVLSQRPGRSGSGVYLAAMVREAAARGLRQHLIVAGPPGTSAAEVPGLEPEEFTLIPFPSAEAPFPVPGNSDVMPYPSTVFSQMTERQVEQYLAVSERAFERVRSGFRPDVVHSHHLWLMTALARRVFATVPMVASSHNAELRQLIKAPHLAPRVLPGIQALDRVGVLTPRSRRDTVAAFGVDDARIEITGAGFRQDLFTVSERPRRELRVELERRFGVRLPAEVDDPERCRVVAFVGRLSTPKGVPFLLRAIERLRRRRGKPSFRLLLVGATGSGDDGPRVAGLVAAAGPEVIHTGALPQEAVALALQGSDLFVLPSLFEGLPLTMLEAAACGCACLVSGLPTVRSWVPRRWIRDRHFALVPPLATTDADRPVGRDEDRFVEALAAALADLLDRPRSLDARRTLAAEMEGHSWDRVFARYARIYEQLLLAAALRAPGGRPRSAARAARRCGWRRR